MSEWKFPRDYHAKVLPNQIHFWVKLLVVTQKYSTFTQVFIHERSEFFRLKGSK